MRTGKTPIKGVRRWMMPVVVGTLAGGDRVVRQFAQETLPVVKHHLTMAKELESKLPSHVAQGSPQ